MYDPQYFIYAAVALISSGTCLVLAFRPQTVAYFEKHQNDFLLNLFDAIGLSVFCVCGIEGLIGSDVAYSRVTLIFAGTITGVGGGVLRDIFSAEIPLLLRKHVYFLPSLIGSTLYTFIYPYMPALVSMGISIGFIIVVRILAIVYRWNIPTPLGRK